MNYIAGEQSYLLVGLLKDNCQSIHWFASKLSNPKKAGRKSFFKLLLYYVSVKLRTSAEGTTLNAEMDKESVPFARLMLKTCCKCKVGLHVECFKEWDQK